MALVNKPTRIQEALGRLQAAPASSFLPYSGGRPTLAEALFPPKGLGNGRKKARAFVPPPRTAPVREEDAYEEFPKLDHVWRDERNKRWDARWVDRDHLRRHRCYSDAKEGSKEASYAMIRAFVAGLNPPPPPVLRQAAPPGPRPQTADTSFADMLASYHALLNAKGVPKDPSFAEVSASLAAAPKK